MLELAAGTGLRSSELRALTWGDLDLDRQRIVVSRQIDTDDIGQRTAIKDRALSESRIVPLTDALTGKLRDLRATRAEHGQDDRPDAFVFGGDRHVRHGTLDMAFRKAVAAAGIERHRTADCRPTRCATGTGRYSWPAGSRSRTSRPGSGTGRSARPSGGTPTRSSRCSTWPRNGCASGSGSG
jgi:integrase